MAPPTTPIIRAPEPLDVYLPSFAMAREKIAGHIMEWNRPTPTKSNGLFVTTVAAARMVLMTDVTRSCVCALILLTKLPQRRPTNIPPQYNAADRKSVV